MKTTSIAIVLLTAMLMSCATGVPYQESPFIKWEHGGNINSFDKASAYTASFLAKRTTGNSTILEFQGKQLDFASLGKIQENSDIESFKVQIPGPLAIGQHIITAKQTVGGMSAIDTLILNVHPTRLAITMSEDGQEISNEEEITGLIKSLSKGDVLEFYAIPSSGVRIPGEQFRTIIKGTSKDVPIIGTSVHYSDNYSIPLEAEKISVKINWQDPLNQNVSVQLFPSDGSEFVETIPGLKRPRIVCGDISRITDGNDPIFYVSCEIKPPTYTSTILSIDKVRFEIMEQNIKGYKVMPLGSPVLTNGKWHIAFKLDGKLPLPKGIGGSIKVRIKAVAKSSNGELSPEATKTCKFNVVY
ncbi:MAG: hypothetical protein ACO323_01645 [Candidatus Kapaibacteriota bacterium]